MAAQPPYKPDNPRVRFETSEGAFTAELFPHEAPNTVKNFLTYVREGYYEGTIFHRVIKGFVAQGGGILPNGRPKSGAHDPIKLEISDKLRHWDGALSMARTMDPHSATSQFYVCDGPQANLDDNYAVFGIVNGGKETIDKILAIPTGRGDRPKKDVVIEKATVENA